MPLTAAGDVTGLLLTSRGRERGPYTDADVAAVAGLAERAGAGIAHAAEFARHRRDSQALQEGLVPAPPPVPGRVEVAWRSTPAPGEVVGGDWWDIVALPGMRTALVVGDVMGHGPAAVMLLAQLRAAAHTLADLDLPPAEMMGRLDRSAAALTGGTCATCVYAVVDPAEGSCTMALAGHLPPVVALPDGRTYVPPLPAGMPVGLGTGCSARPGSSCRRARSWRCTPTGWWRAGPARSSGASWPCARPSPVSTVRSPTPVTR